MYEHFYTFNKIYNKEVNVKRLFQIILKPHTLTEVKLEGNLINTGEFGVLVIVGLRHDAGPWLQPKRYPDFPTRNIGFDTALQRC